MKQDLYIFCDIETLYLHAEAFVRNLIVGKSYEDDRDIAITQSFAITDPVTGKSKSLTLENNLPQFAELQTDRGGEQSQSPGSRGITIGTV